MTDKSQPNVEGREPGAGGQFESNPDLALPKKQQKKIDRRTREALDVMRQVVKAIKTVSIYSHNQEAIDSFTASAHATLSAFLAQYGSMPLQIQSGCILFNGEEIYREDIESFSFAYKFFRDGIRRVSFLQGITKDELQKFVNVCSACSQVVSVQLMDIVASLWKQSFTHLDYVVIKGLAPILGTAGVDEKTMDAEVDDLAEIVAARLPHEGMDEDLNESGKGGGGQGWWDAELEELAAGIQKTGGDGAGHGTQKKGRSRKGSGTAGSVIPHISDVVLKSMDDMTPLSGEASLLPANYQDIARKELEGESEALLLSKLFTILLLLVRLGYDEREKDDISENVLLVMDMMLARESFAAIEAMFAHLDGMIDSKETAPEIKARITALRDKLMEGLGTDLRLEKIKQILSGPVYHDPENLVAVLGRMDETAFRKIPEIIVGRATTVENVVAACRVFQKPHPGLDYCAKQLMSSTKTEAIMAGLKASALVDFEGKGELVKEQLNHSEKAIRLEAIKTIATVQDETAHGAVGKALEDTDREILYAALEAVRRCDPAWAGETLARIMAGKTFSSLTPDVQQRFLRAASSTGAPEVLEFFRQLMVRKEGFFQKKEARSSRIKVVDALRTEATIVSYQTLLAYSKEPRIPADIREICERAAGEVKKILLGD
jgi:hypothetical protein